VVGGLSYLVYPDRHWVNPFADGTPAEPSGALNLSWINTAGNYLALDARTNFFTNYYRQYWEDGRPMPVCDLRTGQVDFHDLKRDPVALLDKPYHDLFFYLPRCALDAIADDAEAPRIGDLNHEPVAFDDSTISNLRMAMLPALSHPDQASQLFIDHVLLAVGIHVAQTYGGMRALPRPVRGVAGEARQGSSLRQPRWSCAAQRGGSGVPLVGESFLARVSPLHGSSAAQLASHASRRPCQGEAARRSIVAAGCGARLRLC
jgi:hypothetical protein